MTRRRPTYRSHARLNADTYDPPSVGARTIDGTHFVPVVQVVHYSCRLDIPPQLRALYAALDDQPLPDVLDPAIAPVSHTWVSYPALSLRGTP